MFRGVFMKNIIVKGISKNKIPYLKGFIYGTIVSCITIALLMILFALAITVTGKIPTDFLGIAVCILEALGVFAGSFTALKIIKSGGLLNGIILGFIIFLIIFASGMIASTDTLSQNTLIKLVCSLVAGAVGGLAGVNTGKKIHY